MKRINSIVLVLLAGFYSPISSAQTEPINSDLKIEIIDQEKVEKTIAGDNRLLYIVITTTGCGGTPLTLKYIKEVKEKYGDSVTVLILFSDRLSDSSKVKTYAKRYDLQGQYYIIDPKYKERSDGRKKGHYFKNSFCKECAEDVISTPYNILVRNGKVLFHGSRFIKNPIPSDIVTYFVRK